jgi:demethylmenaquinone methyltransferase/2-methoxy-6-polyprenyl-1,4-benzoquinol methylase
VDKESSTVRAMFTAIAPRYDLLNHLLSANQDVRWRRRAVTQLGIRRGELVLDLCCGTGDLGLECLRQQPRCRVIGADFALPMLSIAQEKRVPGSGFRVPVFAAADALRLPFTDATFDVITIGFGARNFENTEAGLREMARVLKPGGRVLILEFMRPASPLVRRGFALFFKGVLPLIGRLISQHGWAYNYLPESVDAFYTRREFEMLLRQTGFESGRSFDFNLGGVTSFLARKSG